MALFEPGWKKKDPAKVLQWINKQQYNSDGLIDAVLGREEPEIRKAALERITRDMSRKYIIDHTSDDALLEEIIRGKTGEEIRRYAAAKIGDPAVLTELAKDRYLCAVEALEEEPVLLDIILDPAFFRAEIPGKPSGNLRAEYLAQAAFRRLKTPDLTEIAKKTPYGIVAREVVGRIEDRELLKKIALDSGYGHAARICAQKGLDLEELIALYRSDTDTRVRESAEDEIKARVKNVTDPDIRRKCCAEFGTHDWEWVENDHHDVGDTRTIISRYRCRYCGLTRQEEESYKF